MGAPHLACFLRGVGFHSGFPPVVESGLKLAVEVLGISHVAKNQRHVRHPTVCGKDERACHLSKQTCFQAIGQLTDTGTVPGCFFAVPRMPSRESIGAVSMVVTRAMTTSKVNSVGVKAPTV